VHRVGIQGTTAAKVYDVLTTLHGISGWQ